MPITMTITEQDFQFLVTTSMEWEKYDFGSQVEDGRFEHYVGDTHRAPIRHDWKVAYWLGEDYTTVLFAKAFLDDLGEPYELLWDLVENPECSWVLVTNYLTPTMAKMVNK